MDAVEPSNNTSMSNPILSNAYQNDVEARMESSNSLEDTVGGVSSDKTSSKVRLPSPPNGTKDSMVSQASTLQYLHEPFIHFEPKVRDLCRLLWPGPASEPSKPFVERMRRRVTNVLGIKEPEVQATTLQQSKRVVVEHMRGGSYNRVTGIAINGYDSKANAQMVLRVPRMGLSPSMEQDMAILQFLQKHTQIPAPVVIAHDTTCDNPLNEPYVILSRIPGNDLESKAQPYPGLSHEQKLLFVEEFSSLLLAMQKVQHPWAGRIIRTESEGTKNFSVGSFEVFQEEEDLITKRSEILPFFKVRPFGIDESALIESTKAKHDLQSPLYFFEVQFARWRNLELGLDPSELWQSSVWHRLQTAAKEMDEFGCLDCESYCLTHYDLDPRNIMVEIQHGIPKITGIVDWDLAVFAPDWVSCKPPMWIWNWLDGGSEDESQANEDPPTAEQQELKNLFDDLVGFDFRFNAYQPHYRLARQLFRFARYGLPTAALRDEAEKVLKEWEAMYEKKQAAWEERENEEEGDTEAKGGGEEEQIDVKSEQGQEDNSQDT